MHLALQVDDIARMICEYAYDPVRDSGRHSLANLARVQKGLGAFALDILWREIPAGALLYLFPPKSVTFNSKGERVTLQPLFKGDWSRFSHYAPRIRSLQRNAAGSHWTDLVINFVEFLEALTIYKPKIHILPDLQEIGWWSTLSEISKLTVFIGPSLRSFSVEHDPFGPDDVLPLERAMVTIISSLCDAKPSLEEIYFHFELDMVPLSPRTEGMAVSLFQNFHHLTHVGIKPSVALMRALGVLPALKLLTLWSVDKPSASDSVDRQESETLFTTLETLIVRSGTLESVTGLLQRVQCFARSELHVRCSHFHKRDEVSMFLEVAIDSVHSRNLRAVILCYVREDDLVPGLLHNLRDHSEYHITLSHIRPLLTCRNLELFFFDNGLFPMMIDDNDLQVLTSAWPDISSLDFGSCIHLTAFDQFQPRVTLQGLAHLATCSRLEYLSLCFAVPNSDEINSLGLHSAEPSYSPLKQLQVQMSEIGHGCTVAMACFLGEHFPMLQNIYSGYRALDIFRDKWEEVNVGLKSIREMVDRLKRRD